MEFYYLVFTIVRSLYVYTYELINVTVVFNINEMIILPFLEVLILKFRLLNQFCEIKGT